MEPILSDIADKAPRHEAQNAPHDLLSRLYREIGISAVAAALEISSDALDRRPSAREHREMLAKRAA